MLNQKYNMFLFLKRFTYSLFSDCSLTGWYQLRPFWWLAAVVMLTHVYIFLIRWLGDPDDCLPRPDGVLPFPLCKMTS